MKTIGFACTSADEPLEPYLFERRAPRPNDIVMEILFSGVCHSDLHQVKNDWGWTQYPIVPGHEIVGRVIEVGSAVTKYDVGDHVAVGCMVDSCMDCDQCISGEEQYCRNGMTQTYNSPDRISGDMTYGGYSKHLVVREEFALKVPAGLDVSRVPPLLCAGITTYSPLRTWNVGPGSRVAVAGMGGLGHMAIKFAVALGAHVTVLSRTPEKKADAEDLGATGFLVTTSEQDMATAQSGFDLIIDTIPVRHDVTPYLPLLDVDGTICLVGQLGDMDRFGSVPMIIGRRRISGSAIGGIRQTQEMLDFCARMNILPDCEVIKMQEINEAFKRLEKGEVHYRFVIDMGSLEAA